MDTPFKRITRAAAAACRKTDGSITLLTGLMFPLVLLAAGGAVDISNAHSAQEKAQRTLDATVLSLARSGLSDDEINRRGETDLRNRLTTGRVNAMLEGATFDSRSSAVPGEGDTLTASATLKVGTRFIRLFGMDDLTITVTASSARPNPLPFEIAMVLDVSGSMNNDLNGQPRIDRLKTASATLFDALDTIPNTAAAPSIAVVPYSTSVNIGNLDSGILEGLSVALNAAPPVGDDIWAAERIRATGGTGFDLSDDGPAARPIPFVTAAEMPTNYPIVRVSPLTDNRAAYTASVEALVADGNTAGHLGMIWGVYALSPKWSAVWPQDPRPYGQARKVIVMLTDGSFNTTHAVGDRSTTDGETSYAYFQESCKLARQNGIMIFAVALQLNADAEQRLQQCVDGSGGQLLRANGANGLDTAFGNIARQLGALRLSS